MKEGTQGPFETASLLPEPTRYIGDVVSKLAVCTPTVPLQVETARLALGTCTIQT